MQKPIATATQGTAHLVLFAWIWLAAGVLALALFPALRHTHPTFGWLPFWCVVAPTLDLALIERTRWLALSRTWLRRAAHRHRPVRQARRHAPRRRARLAPLLAALLSR